MLIKWIGAVLIVVASAGIALTMAACHKRQVASLKDLIYALDFMECELQFRMLSLPQLCRQTAAESQSRLGHIFTELAQELDSQISPDAHCCMQSILLRHSKLPEETRKCLMLLGENLGRFDLSGQLKGLEAVREECRQRLSRIRSDGDDRLRSYQTIGICAGAALVILLI